MSRFGTGLGAKCSIIFNLRGFFALKFGGYGMGRPTKYNEETVSGILVQIMMGRSLSEICRTEKWAPSKKTVIRWLHRYREFRHRYARAREIQVHSIMDEVPGMIRGGLRVRTIYERAGISFKPAGAEKAMGEFLTYLRARASCNKMFHDVSRQPRHGGFLTYLRARGARRQSTLYHL